MDWFLSEAPGASRCHLLTPVVLSSGADGGLTSAVTVAHWVTGAIQAAGRPRQVGRPDAASPWAGADACGCSRGCCGSCGVRALSSEGSHGEQDRPGERCVAATPRVADSQFSRRRVRSPGRSRQGTASPALPGRARAHGCAAGGAALVCPAAACFSVERTPFAGSRGQEPGRRPACLPGQGCACAAGTAVGIECVEKGMVAR